MSVQSTKKNGIIAKRMNKVNAPTMSTDKWLFFDDCVPDKKKQPVSHGPYMTDWLSKYASYGKRYKDKLPNNVCLPEIAPVKSSESSKWRSPVYSRFTRSQHERKEILSRVERVIKDQNEERKIQALTFQLSADADYDTVRNANRRGSTDLTKELPSKEASYQKEATTPSEFKKTNLYTYYAKPAPEPRKPKNSAAKKKKKDKEEEHPWDSPEEVPLKKALQEYCDWVIDIGSEENNIDESTLKCLFSSGYDTAPAMSVPIVMLNPSEVPDDIRDISVVPPPKDPTAKIKIDYKKDQDEKNQANEANRYAFRYGCWYIHPKHWKKMLKDEKLIDPKELEMEEDMTEIKMKRAEMAEELAPLYITEAFGKFLRDKRARVPEFLVEVQNIPKKTVEKDQETDEELE